MQAPALDAQKIVENLVTLADTGLPVAITKQADGSVQVGILNLVDLTDDDYFVRPIPIEQLAEEGEKV